MAESLGEAVLDLRTENRGFDRDIDGAERKAEGLDKTFQRIGGNMSAFGDKMTLGVTLPLAAAGAAAFKLAADASEASNKFEVVMGGAADRTRATLKALEDSIPLTTGEMLNLAAGVQDMLVPMGLARDAGADMSAQMVSLAGDIAAFNNTTPAQVIDDMKSALAGSSEPLFKYGVDTRVASLEAIALANGLIEQGEALDNAARSQAVLLQIQAQSTDAMGAAEREADGAAQSTQFLFREIKQLGEEIGTVLIPIFVPMIQGLRDIVSWFRELNPAAQTWIVRIGLLVAALGPLLSITGRLFTIGGKIAGMMITNTAATTANTTATVANKAALAGTGGLASALGTATLALGAFWAGWKAGEFLADQLGIQENAVANWWDSVREAFGAESVADIRASADAVSQTFGTYRTQAQIAADETTRLAKAAADELAPALFDVANAQTAGTQPAADYAAAIAALGIVSEKELDTELNNLTLAIQSGEVPAATMRPLLESYREKLEELGRLSPEVAAALDGLTDSIDAQDAAIDGIVGEIPKATEAFGGLENLFAQLPAVVVPAGDSVEQALTKMAAAGETNAFALAEMIAKSEGLTLAQATVLTQFRDNTDEMQIQAEKLRGEWGPAIQASTEKMLGLDATARSATTGIEGFFSGFQTGIPMIDGFLAKADGIIGSFGGILDGILGGGEDGGGIGSTISGFFSSITGGLTDGAGGLFDSIKGIFGAGGGGEGGGGIPGIFSSLGGGSGEGFLGGLSSILGGGGEGGGIGGFFSSILGGGGEGGGGIGGMLSGLLGGLGQSGGGGFIGGLTSILGTAANFIPVIGPFISAFAGPLIKGISAIGKKIGGFFGKMFGGVSAAEKEARKIGSSLDDSFRAMLSAGQLAEAAAAAQGTANDQWAVSNIAIRDSYLAAGFSIEQAVAATDRLAESIRKSPEEAQAAADAVKLVTDQVQVGMDATGLGLQELRDLVANTASSMSTDTTTAFNNVLAAAEQGVELSANKISEFFAGTVDTASTTATDVATATAAAVATTTQATAEQFAIVEQTATATLDRVTTAFANTDLTLDVEFDVGDLELPGGGGGEGGKKIPAFAKGGVVSGPRGRAKLAVVHGGETVIPNGGGAGGGGGGSIIVPVNLDGREITKVVVRLTPEVRRKLGLS